MNKVNVPQYIIAIDSGAVMWNSLPLELKKAEFLNQFKRLIKEVI